MKIEELKKGIQVKDKSTGKIGTVTSLGKKQVKVTNQDGSAHQHAIWFFVQFYTLA